MSLQPISEALRRRGVRRVVHLHTDHFEPWRHFPGATDHPAECIKAVERFIEVCADNPITRRQTLFYKAHLNYELDDSRELYRADPDDRLGFAPVPEEHQRNATHMLQALDAAGHELQLHVHHENFNFSARPPADAIEEYLAADGWRYDAARLELSIQLYLDSMRRACGKPDAVWFFVHGHWALNASDVRECTIVREIEILMRNGCAGDFTFPAGREHVDPCSDVPTLVRPVALPKGYDRAEADPVVALGGGRPADRFFIWQTPQRHRLCSLDYYSAFVRKRFETPEITARALAETGCVLDGTLYHKTHAHSMHPKYWEESSDPYPPLLHPGAQAELGLLFDAAEAAGAEIDFVTAAEVYREMTGAPAARTARPPTAPDPMLGRESIRFVDADGRPTEPPPAPVMLRAFPPLTVHVPRPAGTPAPSRPVVTEAVMPPAEAKRPAGRNGANAGKRDFDSLAAEINEIACAEAIARLTALGPEKSGVTGFYATRAHEGALLCPAERVLAKQVLAARGVHRAYEIGSGLGLLSLLLAAAGKPATGIERHGPRFETSRAIQARVARVLPKAGEARLIKGKFPQAAEFDLGLNRSAALLTNLLGGADFEEQLHVIQGLAAFKYAYVDLMRFYERRPDIARQRELIRLYRVAGFGDPRELFDLGDDGKYVLFTNPSPVASSLPEVAYRRARRGLTRMYRQLRKN